MFGGETSKLHVKSFAPEPIEAHAGSFFRKGGLARNVRDGLSSPAEHVEAAFPLDAPLHIRAKLSQDVERAISFVAEIPNREVRLLWKETLIGLIQRAAELEGMRRCELLGPHSHSRPSVSKVHLPCLREELLQLGMGRGLGESIYFGPPPPYAGAV